MTSSSRTPKKSRSAKGRRPGSANVASEAPDTGVVISVLLLASMGTVMSYSITATLALDHSIPPLFLAHLGALGVGILIAGAIMWTPIERWRQAALPLWLISILLLVAVEFFGVEVNGAQRWLAAPGPRLPLPTG